MTEQYYIDRDEFVRYIINEVNPERLKAGLKEVGHDEAVCCFRIIYDFREKWMQPAIPQKEL